MSLKTEKRGREIVRLLLLNGKTSVDELKELFGTSIASVRRDLVRLESLGLVHRTHGGALIANSIYEPFRFDASFHEREGRFAVEKERIAFAAAFMVCDGDSIGITAGTTTAQVARAVLVHAKLKIVTNAVNIAMELSGREGFETTLTGGCMRWPDASSLIGPVALKSLKTMTMNRLFVGVTGVDATYGATTIQPEEAVVFREMTRRAKQVIVVADSSKVGMVSAAEICPVTAIQMLVTDSGISAEAVSAFEAAGVRVMVV